VTVVAVVADVVVEFLVGIVVVVIEVVIVEMVEVVAAVVVVSKDNKSGTLKEDIWQSNCNLCQCFTRLKKKNIF
jgi:hypothetical protein